MIVSASYRTDIPAYYGAWFLRRLEAGVSEVGNPYGGRPYRVSLKREDVDGFVFWTRNVAPFAEAMTRVTECGIPFVVQHTLTGYPRALERSAPASDEALTMIRRVAAQYGRRAVVWRYDPVVATGLTPLSWHVDRFAVLAAGLRGATDEVVISFAHPYRKTRRGLDAAARAHGFAWRDPEAAEKRHLAARLAVIAADHGMTLTICSQPELAGIGVARARCIDAVRLSDVAGRPIAPRQKGNRPGCDCAESRDIGAYDTCPMGCAFCYAVASRVTAQRAATTQDAGAVSLGPQRAVPARG